ncbi:uncharacterized protein LOC143855500 isoform X2 [Tasmannia lanceolata]|uniref:uncharacterized protein LOC143855500 isoform X2 n=1 Tax=Tasmannia lanceolata TaxID=3420 RepID=UPI004062F51B
MVNHFWNMESNVVNSNSHETNPSAGSTLVREEIQLTEKSVNISPFINQAAISWNERRKEWVGDQSQKSHKMPREQVISWSTTYDDLLSTNQPFSQSIPLTSPRKSSAPGASTSTIGSSFVPYFGTQQSSTPGGN